jgi:hypothetical protein
VSGFENAIFQWQQGERKLGAVSEEQSKLLERIIEVLVAELRRRLGGQFRSDELVELYESGTTWCLELAIHSAPNDPWAWDSRLVVDAAFSRYLRQAVDYAGGKRTLGDEAQAVR